jgi:hypothetical protein
VTVIWGQFFREVLGFAVPAKWQSVQKKGQAETCPYPQKEAKIKTYIYDTTKVYLVKQKGGFELGGMQKTLLSWQAGSVTGNRYLILVGQ